MLITKLETFTKRKVKTIPFDSGGEFLDTELRNWFKSKGITLEISAPDMQQQNEVAEQYNCTTHERALAMLKDLELANRFWPEAHEYLNSYRSPKTTNTIRSLSWEETRCKCSLSVWIKMSCLRTKKEVGNT